MYDISQMCWYLSSFTSAAPLLFKDIVTIDKRKMQEELESIPKPEHITEAEKELLSYEGLKRYR